MQRGGPAPSDIASGNPDGQLPPDQGDPSQQAAQGLPIIPLGLPARSRPATPAHRALPSRAIRATRPGRSSLASLDTSPGRTAFPRISPRPR